MAEQAAAAIVENPAIETPEPDYVAMSDAERLDAAAEALALEEPAPELEPAPVPKKSGRKAKTKAEPAAAVEDTPESTETGQVDDSEASSTDTATEELEQTPEQVELARLRQLEKEKDSAFAQLRRQDAAIKAERAQLARDREEVEAGKAKIEWAERMQRMARENPLMWHEESAKLAELKGSELLERVQRRYLNQGQPGAAEQQDELRAMRAEVAKLAKALEERDRGVAQEREVLQLQTQKQSEVGQLDRALDGPGASHRWQLLHALKGVGGDAYNQTLTQAVELVHQTGGQYALAEVLDHLEKQERMGYERGELIGSRLRGELGSGTPGNLQKPASGTGTPATTRKPAAAQRTVTNQDAANSSGARRELTPAERLDEADKILREGIVRS